MKKGRIKDAVWYPYAVAACIAVVLFIFLYRFPSIWAAVGNFIGYFKPVILGCVIAYIVNPLARLFQRLFKRMKRDGLRDLLSNALAFIIVLLVLVFAVVIMVPQLLESIETFTSNLDGYIDTLEGMLESWGISRSTFDLSGFVSSSESLLDTISNYATENLDSILSASASVGRNLLQWIIAFILSIYFLAEKGRLSAGLRRLLRALFGDERYEGISTFLHRCNEICTRFIVYNLIDCLIVGAVNAIFMAIAGMQYVGLVSFIVGLTNLVPTFGPVVGAILGAFILLMVKPVHALMFLVFALLLQLIDGYLIKPKLFGSSLGISGLWIIVGVVVGGSMFGVVGILLSIPAMAILDLIYRSYLIPAFEARHGIKAEDEDEAGAVEAVEGVTVAAAKDVAIAGTKDVVVEATESVSEAAENVGKDAEGELV